MSCLQGITDGGNVQNTGSQSRQLQLRNTTTKFIDIQDLAKTGYEVFIPSAFKIDLKVTRAIFAFHKRMPTICGENISNVLISYYFFHHFLTTPEN